MNRQEISKQLYKEMAAEFDAYKSVEQEYRAETDYYKKQAVITRLTQARGNWLLAVERFRTHLVYLKHSLVE